MTDRHTETSGAIRDSWDFWLKQHAPTIGDIITDAVEAATGKWLASNKDELLDRIANAMADRVHDAADDLGRGD